MQMCVTTVTDLEENSLVLGEQLFFLQCLWDQGKELW